MSKLVEFLLARAETHPEEFYEDRKADVKHHWMHYVKQYKKFMTEEEYRAIWGKVSEINLEYAMEQVTNKLLTPEPEADYMTAFGSAHVRAEGQQVAYALQHRYGIEEIQAKIEYQRQQMEKHLKTSVFDEDFK